MDIFVYVIAIILLITFISFFCVFIDLIFKFDNIEDLERIPALVKHEKKKIFLILKGLLTR